MTYAGDFAAGATVRFGFNTTAIAGESITIATDGTINVYKDGGLTQSVAGVTFSENFDGFTGAHLVTIVTSDAFYTAASDYTVMLSGATIDGKAINAWIGEFSIQNRYASTAPSAATIAAAVWDRATSALTMAGSIGKWLLDHIGAVETSISTLGASGVTLESPVREVGGEQVIELVQGQTQSIANGNSIDIVFDNVPDTTGGAVTLTLTDEMGTIQSVTGNPYTGTLGAWAAGSVTARFEMTAAQTASIAIKLSAALEKNSLRFQVKLTLAVNGVIIPIAPKNGRVTVLTAAHA